MGNVIKQTNRTMLLEEINPGKLDFLTLVGDVRGVESLSDDKIKEIHDHLLVRSFDELLEIMAEGVVLSHQRHDTEAPGGEGDGGQ